MSAHTHTERKREGEGMSVWEIVRERRQTDRQTDRQTNRQRQIQRDSQRWRLKLTRREMRQENEAILKCVGICWQVVGYV